MCRGSLERLWCGNTLQTINRSLLSVFPGSRAMCAHKMNFDPAWALEVYLPIKWARPKPKLDPKLVTLTRCFVSFCLLICLVPRWESVFAVTWLRLRCRRTMETNKQKNYKQNMSYSLCCAFFPSRASQTSLITFCHVEVFILESLFSSCIAHKSSSDSER